MREFYKERNVVIEERRMRTDSNPIGRLLEQFTEAAFTAHPYHRPTVGWMSDLNSFSATDAQKFFDKYYVPSNMVVAVAGDVKACAGHADPREIFRTPARAPPARRDHDHRASAKLRAPGRAEGTLAAALPRGLPPPRLPQQRRRRLRRHHRPDVRRPHLAPLSRAGARQENRLVLRRLHRISRREVSAPVRVSRRSRCPATRRRKWPTPSTRKSTG